MANTFKIKTSAGTATLEGKEGLNILKIGEMGYSYVSGDSDGGDRLFIGIGPAKSNGYASEYVTIAGEYYTQLLSAPIGKLKGGKALIVDANGKIETQSGTLNIDDLEFTDATVAATSGALTLRGFDGTVSFGGDRLTDVATPTAGTDGVNKDYVDNLDLLHANADENLAGTGNITAGDRLEIKGSFNTNTKRHDLADGAQVDIYLDSDVTGLSSLEVDNVRIDGNTISTLHGDMVLDPSTQTAAGTLVVQGNLQVEGTTTTINSTTLTIDDKNIELAQGAADANAADSAGISVQGANAHIYYKATPDTWNFNRKVVAPNIKLEGPDGTPGAIEGSYAGFDSDFAQKTTTDLPEGSNLYYTTARHDSDFDVRLATKTTDDVAEGTNLYYTTDRHDQDTLSQVDSSYVQARQDYAYSSLTGVPTNVSTFINDANYLDSTTVQGVIDASYVTGLIDTTYLDSAEVIDLVDSAYINARVNSGNFLDSAEAIALVDSAYVQARQTPQDFAYSSLTGAPTNVSSFTNDANYLDSTTVLDVVDQTYVRGHVDAPYIQTLIDATYLDSAEAIALIDSTHVQARQDYAYSSLTGTPTNVSSFTNDANYLDSTTVTGVIDQTYVTGLIDATYLDSAEAIDLIDASHVQARQITYNTSDFTDSAFVTGLPVSTFTNDANYLDSATATTLIDSAFVQARQSDSAQNATNAENLGGQPPSYYTDWNNITNPPAILDTVDVSNIIVNDVDKTFVDGLGINADKLDGLDRQQFLRADQSDSMVGSLHIDSNLVIGGYIAGPEIFYIDPNTVGDNTGKVVIRGNLQVDGTETIVNSTTVTINDKNIILADSAADSAEADGAGITVNGSNATITYNATSDKWEFNKDIAAGNINATVTGTFTGFDSDFDARLATKTTTNVAEGTNLYYTTARHDSDTLAQVDSSYVQARQTPQDFAYSSLTGAPTNVSSFVNDANYLDSTTVQGVITANYIDGLVNLNYLDSAEAIQLVDSAYVRARSSNQTLDTTSEVDFATVDAPIVFTAKNAEGFTITKGQVVYVNGVSGEVPTVRLANAGSSATMPAFGLVYEDANSNSEVSIVTFGNFTGLDTSAFNTGDTLFVDTTNGALTNVKPAGESNLIQNIGKVVRVHASSGVIRVGGAGRSAATPNLDNDQFFLGNDSNYAVATDFTAAVTAVVDSNFVRNRVPTDQDLRTTDSVSFSGLTVSGDLTVTGNTYQVNTIAYTINDPLIHLADSNEQSDVVDIGTIGHYYRDGQRRHTGIFRDASNEEYYIFNNMVDSAFDSALPPNVINRSATDFELSTLNVGTLRGIYAGFDSDFSQKTTSDLTEGSNLYYTTARANTDIDTRVDSAYVQARQDFAYSSLTGAPTNVSSFTNDANYLDSTTAQTLIDASYIQSNQTDYLDSNLTIQLIDSDYVRARQITYDFMDSAEVIDLVDSAYVQARTPQIDLSAVDQHIVPASGSLYDLGDSNYFWRDLYLSGSTIILGDLKLAQHTGRLRITNRHSGAEVKLAAQNIGNHKIDSSVVTSLASATASALPVSTFANDANYLDSTSVKVVIDSTYIATAIETDSNVTVTIVNNITDTVDSAYVLDRIAEAPFLDSADAIQLIDSTYVQARQTPQDFAYSSLTGAPTNVSAFANDANYLDSTTVQALLPSFGNDFVDSATVINIINSEGLDSDLVIALVDSAYIQLRDRFQDSSLVTSTVDATYVQARQIKYNTSDFLDSNTVSLVVDSAYIAARTTAGTDSAAIINLIDSDYVNARVSGADSAINASEALNADKLDGQHGSYYLDYNNFTNTPSIPNVDKSYVDALNVDADTLDGQDGTYYLNYNNLSNTPTTLTTTDVKNIFNSSGDDEISTGAVVDAKYLEFPHDGGTQHSFSVEVVSKTSAHRYQGSGSSNGYQIDGVESPFLQLVPGNTYRFDQSNGTNGSHQLRFYYDAARTTAYTSGVTYNGVAGNAGAYTEIVISESTPPVLYYQCVNHGYMGNAVFTQTRNLTGFTTDDLTQGSTNLYYDSSTTTAIIDSDYIQTRTRIGLGDIDFGANKILYANVYSTTGDLPSASTYHGMFAHVHGTGKGYFAHAGSWVELANASDVFDGNYNSLSNKPSLDFLDSALAIQLIDSAYVQARQTTVGSGSGGIDSAAVINLVDSAYVTARYTGSGITLATARAGLSVITGAASGGGALSYDNSTGEFTFNPSTNTGGGGGSTSGTADGITLTKFVYTADSGQLAFTDSDDTGDVLAYNTADTQINVYLNGILLVDSDDFTLTDSSTVTLTSAAALNDVVQIIKYTPPSASSGGGTGTVDSADIEIIVDSNYVQNRMGSLAQGTLDVNKYFFDASANQSVFTGNDKFGNLFSVDPLRTEVFLNGVLQELTTDYSITASQVNLTDPADSGYSLTVIETIGRVNTHQSMVETVYEFDADSGQTTFTGVDRGGINTLAMADGIVSVFINGILISETNDYTKTSDTLTLLDAADSGDFVSVKVTSGVVASTLNTDQYTFTGQTSKTLTGGGLGFTGNVQIFKNGSILKQSEFAVSNGDTITLVDSAISSDVFVVQTFNAQEFAAKTFDYIADSGQTIFSGADRHGEILRYQEAGCIVYLNGIALVDSSDYVTTNNGTITFNDPVNVNDEVKIYTFIPANLSSIAAPLEFSQFEYTASANQTLFSGADSNGNTLSYDSDKISVYLNGLLLRTEDYTATDGTSVTLSVAADDGDNLTVAKLTGNNIGLDRAEVQAIVDASASNTTWTEVVSPVTVIGGSRNIVDTSAGAITLTLPAVAGIGTEVRVIDGTGNASTNNITIARNGHKIQGGTSNLVIDIDRAGIGLVYYNTAQGWILIEN